MAAGPDAHDPDLLLDRLRAQDSRAWDELLAGYRDRLSRAVAFRIDPRLRGRVDASYVIQEAYLEAHARLPEYMARPTLPIHLWLRLLVGQRLALVHRQHLGTAMRDAGREHAWPGTTADGLAQHLAAAGPSPSEAAARAEARTYLAAALDRMDPTDREVLVLRHFEQLSNGEVAQLLGIETSAASKRYLRALGRLQETLAARPDLFQGSAG
jgi:RNA polymerase sigma-70 factor (ECF subfamily)